MSNWERNAGYMKIKLALITLFLFLLHPTVVSYATSPKEKNITISIVGDILLDRGVKSVIKTKGVNYPYLNVKDIFKKSDIVFGNLECPITNIISPLTKEKRFIFRADINNVKALKLAGFNLLNLANNHSMDQGREGLISTISNVRTAGIITLGAGIDRKDAHRPVFINKNGLKIGFLSFSAFPTEGYFYSESNPDVAHINENMKQEIKEARSKCDYLIVSYHWGKEFNSFPTKSQKDVAHIAVDSGADIVIGHHPHVLQGIERYKSKYIFYSLGNFVFDKQTPKGTDETLILNLTLSKRSKKNIEIFPAKISNCQPKILKGKDAYELLDKLKLFSKGMNSSILCLGDRGIIN